MADILLGRTEGFARYFALKRIRREYLGDSQFIRMVFGQARAASVLQHRHIVEVHEVEESAGQFYIAMEYVHGEDVRKILSAASQQRQHVPLEYAVAIASAAASGLYHAHERSGSDGRTLGLVHRNVSPSNVLVGYDGSIKLGEFGTAKLASCQSTGAGRLGGRVAYLSPEQCRGAEGDRRSDVFALGVVLYELATTSRLFPGDSDEQVMEQIVDGRVAAPELRRPDLPVELSAIIMRALAADPDQRYATAGELRIALDRLAGKAERAAPAAIGAYLRKLFGQRPEPWLALNGAGDSSALDDVTGPSDAFARRNTWTELPGERAEFRSGSSWIPRAVSALSSVGEDGSFDRSSVDQPREPSSAAVAPTLSSSPPAPRRGLAAKLAMVSVPLIAILGVAIWRFAATDGSPSPAAANPTSPIAAAAPPQGATAAQPAATEAVASAIDHPAAERGGRRTEPAPPPPPPPPPAAAAPSMPGARDSEPAPRGTRSHSAPPAPKRSSTVKIAETSPPPLPAPGATPEPPPPTPRVAAPVQPPPVAIVPPAPSPRPELRPAEAPPVQVVQIVTPAVLDANRKAGNKDIVPDPATQIEIRKAGKDKVIAAYRLCVTQDGDISSVTQLKSTGFARFDAKIANTIRDKWHYRPFLIGGKRAPVCSNLGFSYWPHVL